MSGSWDETVTVWRVEGGVAAVRCERTLVRHGGGGCCVVTWGGKVESGSLDKTIRVWDVRAGTREQTLAGHEDGAVALVACGQRPMSSSFDKTVKVWPMATWACVHTVQACAAGSAQCIRSLAVNESTLVGGSCSYPPSRTEQDEARVWDLETLQPLHALGQPVGLPAYVYGLAGDGGEVWGAVGKEGVVRGRRG